MKCVYEAQHTEGEGEINREKERDREGTRKTQASERERGGGRQREIKVYCDCGICIFMTSALGENAKCTGVEQAIMTLCEQIMTCM